MGLPELLIILVIFMLVFGVGKLPQLGKALGWGIREFREGTQGLVEEETSETPLRWSRIHTPPTKARSTAASAARCTGSRRTTAPSVMPGGLRFRGPLTLAKVRNLRKGLSTGILGPPSVVLPFR